MAWKKIINKEKHIAFENKEGTKQVLIYELKGEWHYRHFEKGLGEIIWEPSDIENFKMKEQALTKAKEYMRTH